MWAEVASWVNAQRQLRFFRRWCIWMFMSLYRSTNRLHPKIFLLTSGSLLRKMFRTRWEYLEPKVYVTSKTARELLLNHCWCVYNAAVGEPPICMAVSVFLAVRRAMESARSELKDNSVVTIGQWSTFSWIFSVSCSLVVCTTDAPATPEVIQQGCTVDPSQFTLWMFVD